jgi:ribose transport system substrate-binding protein
VTGGMALVLSGCALTSGDDQAGSVVKGAITFGFVNGGITKFHTCLQETVEKVAQNNFARIRTANSHQDSATELSNIGNMIAHKVDALIVQTVDVVALEDDIAKARTAGTPIFLTSVAPDDTSGILGAVLVDLKKAGKLDAGWIRRDAGAKDVKIVTVNGTDEGLAALKDGRFSATVSNSAADTGELAVENAIDLLRGRKAKKIAKTPAELITKDNADTAPLYCSADGY